MAFYDEPPVQILEPVKQQLTEHGAILYTFFVFATRHVIQLPGVGFDGIQQPADYRTHDRGHDGRYYVFRRQRDTFQMANVLNANTTHHSYLTTGVWWPL